MADTREEILTAAWDLFSKRGFEDVSVRDITTAAEVNLASISYHFGGKEGLIQETVKRCMNPLNEYGLELIQKALAQYGSYKAIPVEYLMECWLRPLLMPEECGVRPDLIQRLVARYLIDHDYSVPLVSRQLINEMFNQYVEAFSVHYPDVSREQIVQHLIFLEGAAIYYSGVGQILTSASDGLLETGAVSNREELLQEAVLFAKNGFAQINPNTI